MTAKPDAMFADAKRYTPHQREQFAFINKTAEMMHDITVEHILRTSLACREHGMAGEQAFSAVVPPIVAGFVSALSSVVSGDVLEFIATVMAQTRVYDTPEERDAVFQRIVTGGVDQ